MEVGHPREVRFKPEKLDELVFKLWTSQAKTSYSRFWQELRDLSLGAGYVGHVKPYSIRYASANKLHGMLFAFEIYI